MSAHNFYRVLVLCSVFLFLAGCGSVKEAGSVDGIVLQYRLPEGQPVKYSYISSSLQKMEMMGQSMEITMESSMLFTMKSNGFKNAANDVSVTLDSVSFTVKSPRGELAPDMNNVNGKRFSMRLSAAGKESDLKGTESIEFELAPGQKQNATNAFALLFPDLAAGPVKPGESWRSKDSLNQTTANGKVLILFESNNTFLGVEMRAGRRCAKIVSQYNGPLRSEEAQGPMTFVTNGTMKGIDTVYFAMGEGVVLEVNSHATFDAVAEGTGAQQISIPVKRELKNGLRLVNAAPVR